MELLEQVHKKIRENQTEMISSLSELISIPSVSVKTEGELPFGESVHKAYITMLEYAGEAGFETYNADNYGGHIDYRGTGTGIVGIAGHLDVVPEGSGWEHDPYGGEVIDGYVWGRGAVDDKGPVVATFYAMKALKQCGFVPDKTVRMILGLDEETNWEGMDYYLDKVGRRPDCGFTPDADFPVIRAEMGIMIFDIIKKLKPSRGNGIEISSVRGGTAANSVPDFARAVINNTAGEGYDKVREKISQAREKNGWKINGKGVGKSFEITVKGLNAHGAKPWMGENAISILMSFLGTLDINNDSIAEFVEFYNSRIGFDLHGERIDCEFEDEASGRLIFNVGMIDIDKNTARITVNIRYPVTSDAAGIYDHLMGVLDRYDMGIVKGHDQLPIYFEEDDKLIKTLMDVYRRQTGDMTSEPLVIGGGTYARAMDNIVAFGAVFPGEPELEHQINERISVSNMIKLADIYAEAIYELSKPSK